MESLRNAFGRPGKLQLRTTSAFGTYRSARSAPTSGRRLKRRLTPGVIGWETRSIPFHNGNGFPLGTDGRRGGEQREGGTSIAPGAASVGWIPVGAFGLVGRVCIVMINAEPRPWNRRQLESKGPRNHGWICAEEKLSRCCACLGGAGDPRQRNPPFQLAKRRVLLPVPSAPSIFILRRTISWPWLDTCALARAFSSDHSRTHPPTPCCTVLHSSNGSTSKRWESDRRAPRYGHESDWDPYGMRPWAEVRWGRPIQPLVSSPCPPYPTVDRSSSGLPPTIDGGAGFHRPRVFLHADPTKTSLWVVQSTAKARSEQRHAPK